MPERRTHARATTNPVVVGCIGLFAGCEPLVNAPPGGGQSVTQTFRYGPFTLGPGAEV